jgi:hypothetical protein
MSPKRQPMKLPQIPKHDDVLTEFRIEYVTFGNLKTTNIMYLRNGIPNSARSGHTLTLAEAEAHIRSNLPKKPSFKPRSV